MNKTLKSLILLVFACALLISAVSCGSSDVWKDAKYTEDTVLGSGSKTVTLELSVEEHFITFTIKTDKATLGEALNEHGLLGGNKSGLYTVFNGMTADYDVNQTFWALYENGNYAMQGIDDTVITEGVVYKLEYSKM